MKQIILLIPIILGTRLALAQDSINPYNIQQHNTIELHNTDVYYHPFAPPASTDTRDQLSCEALLLRDSDGLAPAWTTGSPYQPYVPMTHGVILQNWTPPGDSAPLGIYAVWQRLFQALPKADGTPTDIIAGGDTGERVIISKNEDVDFRASGRVILKSGFHARAGCFFHAYTDPKWDTAVFSDEFDDSAKFQNQWHVTNGYGSNYYAPGPECNYDTLARLDTDYQAHDGHALDLIMRENTVDTCNCLLLALHDTGGCQDSIRLPDTTLKFLFSTGQIRSCPFPYASRTTTPLQSWYEHAPYAKYEIREKIPHIKHHTNNWGGGWVYPFEYDINEADWNADLNTLNPDWGHAFQYGPYTGTFSRLPDSTVIFISSGAQWCLSNNPIAIVINNVAYQVQFVSGRGHDTVEGGGQMNYTGWPTSLVNPSGKSFEFYYAKNLSDNADVLPWQVKYDSTDHKWDKFYAGYHIKSPGDTLYFSKTNQPISITLTTDTLFGVVKKIFNCHWEYNLNHSGDTGWLMLDFPGGDTDSVKTMTWSDLHSGDEAYAFTLPGVLYPVPPFKFDGDDTTGGYEYHTFAMEWLPHEVRYLVDSVVIRRFPDRLVPSSSPYYDWVTTMPRQLVDIRPAETDFDPLGSSPIDSAERAYFEHAAAFETAHPTPGWPGFEMFDGKPVAHHLIDYVKVWDVPTDVTIPDLPH